MENMKRWQIQAETWRSSAVIERHHKTGNVGLGFVQGLGLQRGAIASSVAHDSHNLIVAGMNNIDMLTARKTYFSCWWRLISSL